MYKNFDIIFQNTFNHFEYLIKISTLLNNFADSKN